MDLTADAALKDFQTLKNTKDFIKEGKESFGKHLNGENIEKAKCFVWYFSTEAEEKESLSAK